MPEAASGPWLFFLFNLPGTRASEPTRERYQHYGEKFYTPASSNGNGRRDEQAVYSVSGA